MAIEQTEVLREMGFDCDLIFLRATPTASYSLPSGTRVLEPSSDARPSAARGIARRVTGWFAEHRGADASVDLDLLWRIRKTLGTYSVVVYNDQYAGLLGVWLRLVRGQAYVLMFLEFYPAESQGPGARLLRPLAEALDRLSILLAPAIVTISSGVAERLERLAPGRSYLARLGAPAPTAPPIPLADRERRSVFSVTVWDRGRHPEMYLELARAASGFRFVLAGIWADPAHFEEFCRAASALPNVTVTGPISEARRVEMMNGSLLYLRVGYHESGPGMGGLEALAAGSLVIANRDLGLSEILTDGADGFVVGRADPGEIARLLERIDGLTTEEVERISTAARELARRHSWAEHGRVLAEALQTAVGGERGRSFRPPGTRTDSRRAGGARTGA